MRSLRFERIQDLTEQLIEALGYDSSSDGLRDTPRRVAKLWTDFTTYEAGNCDTAFEMETSDQIVVVKGMRVWSMCEHHLLPFWCDISAGYITRGKVLGLSKFARIAHKHAHKLQLQERLVEQIAEDIRQATATDDVAVFAEGEHLCMTMRGIRTAALMNSSSMHGAFRSNAETRAEFFALIQKR